MTISRRKLLLSSAAAAGAAVLANTAAAGPVVPSPDDTEHSRSTILKATVSSETTVNVGTATVGSRVALKLSCQLGRIPGKDLQEKLATMEKWGFDGVELDGDVVGNERKYEDAVKNTKLKVSAVCWGSCNGDLVSEVVEKRAAGIDALKRVLTSAGTLGSTGVIFVPAFNGQTKLGNQEIRKILVDVLPAVGEHAQQSGTRLLLEPLNRNEAFFLRQVADAASIARDCHNPGIGVMGDFYHMFIEETSDLGAFISGGSYVHHVHLASRTRVLPGQDDRQFVGGFHGLKQIGYRDYCSFECGVRGDPNAEFPKSMAFLREQWAKA